MNCERERETGNREPSKKIIGIMYYINIRQMESTVKTIIRD